MFDQPELEALLRAQPHAAPRRRTARRRRGHRRSPMTPAAACGSPSPTGATARTHTVDADYVLGCDGANSVVRTADRLGHAGFELRAALAGGRCGHEADLRQWEGVHQVCDPQPRRHLHAHRRDPLPVGVSTCWHGETAADFSTIDRAATADRALDRRRRPTTELELLRVTEYTFRAQIADRWRRGNVFLLGDAAHLTPPFIGQGMGAGLRDAMNLAWKLAGVLDRRRCRGACWTPTQQERKPHARQHDPAGAGRRPVDDRRG